MRRDLNPQSFDRESNSLPTRMDLGHEMSLLRIILQISLKIPNYKSFEILLNFLLEIMTFICRRARTTRKAKKIEKFKLKF